MKILDKLEKLRIFLHGAHWATENERTSKAFYRACQMVDEIIEDFCSEPSEDK